MFCAGEEECSKISPEYFAFQKSIPALCQHISSLTTPTWFAHKLQEKGIITPELLNNALTVGIPPYEKVAKLLQAVQIQVKKKPETLQGLMEILREESALEDTVSMLFDMKKGKVHWHMTINIYACCDIYSHLEVMNVHIDTNNDDHPFNGLLQNYIYT